MFDGSCTWRLTDRSAAEPKYNSLTQNGYGLFVLALLSSLFLLLSHVNVVKYCNNCDVHSGVGVVNIPMRWLFGWRWIHYVVVVVVVLDEEYW